MNVPIKALVRPPSQNFCNALSEHPDAPSIDIDKARQQHSAYCEALIQAGLTVEVLPPLDDYPDSVFIEDNAVILGDRAVLTSMKETSRRGESAHLAEALQSRLPVTTLPAETCIDGGDVLQTEDAVFVGLSQRTNEQAVEALRSLTPKTVIPVRVNSGLHLKTSASYLGNGLMVIHSSHIDPEPFRTFEWLEVTEDEAYAANCLAIGDRVILPAGFPQLEKRLQDCGMQTLPIDMSEFQKADGGITCLSLLIRD